MTNQRVYRMPFASVYPLLVKKVERKGRTKAEVDAVIFWLTGYNEQGLRDQLDQAVDMETFYAQAPQINPNAVKIKGLICGHRVEEIADPLMQKVRWLDKLVDELARGKALDKVLRA
ncbi:MAG: DUF2200 domain-containing protein [Bifidobacteriaceae bacterium]|nr:DUF2200 domain-containing protein [Bifidobacteriaceae bacterium]